MYLSSFVICSPYCGINSEIHVNKEGNTLSSLRKKSAIIDFEALIKTSHFSMRAQIKSKRGITKNNADLALVKVIDDVVVELLFELPLCFGAIGLKLWATRLI